MFNYQNKFIELKKHNSNFYYTPSFINPQNYPSSNWTITLKMNTDVWSVKCLHLSVDNLLAGISVFFDIFN